MLSSRQTDASFSVAVHFSFKCSRLLLVLSILLDKRSQKVDCDPLPLLQRNSDLQMKPPVSCLIRLTNCLEIIKTSHMLGNIYLKKESSLCVT